MSRNSKFIVIAVILIMIVVVIFLLKKNKDTVAGAPGQVVELSFEMDKKFEFGEYYFDLANGKGATYPLCFCLTEKNMYPPDCSGDIQYIYKDFPGTTCIPLNIGTGSCSSTVMSSLNFATMFIIPLEYPLTKPFEKIVIGVRVPQQAPVNTKIVVEVTFLKKGDRGQKSIYEKYEQTIIVTKNQ
ncbi:MAG: hypothetical protein H7334_15390 [Ferruginibacter sp.]|nr:hypothetical protein [Ferruginibacter sp.]